MGKSLRRLDKSDLLELNKGSWGGSFGDLDNFHTGRESNLTFLNTGKTKVRGNHAISLKARYDRGGVVSTVITDIENQLNVNVIVDVLDRHKGVTVAELYDTDLGI